MRWWLAVTTLLELRNIIIRQMLNAGTHYLYGITLYSGNSSPKDFVVVLIDGLLHHSLYFKQCS